MGFPHYKYLATISLDLLSVETTIFALILLFIAHRILKARTPYPLPPGPKPWPVAGNLSAFPNTTHAGRFWAQHKKLYGPISCVTAMGTPFIILNDMDATLALLDKRSANYASRYENTFGAKMVNVTRWTAFMPFGPELKRHRKLVQTYVGTVASMSWIEAVERAESYRLLSSLLHDPANFFHYLRRHGAAIILKISHGYTIEPEGPGPLVESADKVIDEILFHSLCTANWVVDTLPFLRHFPSWLPGMSFKRTAQSWEALFSDFGERPYAFVKKQMSEGKDRSSFTSYNIEKGLASCERDEATLKDAAAQLFAAGADTTVSLLKTFFLAMTLFPNVQKKAQSEVDRVVGCDRLPDFEDRDNLPYVSALIKELFRWEQVTPSSVPHLCTQEDTYAGYRIPKGAVVIANIWNISRDSEIYKSPSSVIPERFLGDNPELDPYLFAFGFGRRLCPGKRMADSSLFITISLLLATFDIRKAQDENGHDVEPIYEYMPGVVSHPKPFECSITPRSSKVAELIRSALEEYPVENGHGDVLMSL